MNYSLFISCPRNMEYLLESELKSLGLAVTQVSPMGVYGDADLKTLYTICLWSRLANRVQCILFSGMARDEASLNKLCCQYAWKNILNAEKTFAIDFHGESSFIKNTMYGAQLVKDGIVDYFKAFGVRPSVDKKHPDIRLHAYIKYDKLTVSLDVLGYSLHQRGYRISAGSAPLKENVAAAMLIRADWKTLYDKGYQLVDPFCGSGTLLIEGAMIAANIAPGLLKKDQAFQHWSDHDPALWQATIDAAIKTQQPIKQGIFGFDVDAKVLDIAKENMAQLSVADTITLKQQAIKDFQALAGQALIIANPPYGERLKDPDALRPIYEDLGKALFKHCQGSCAAILTTNPSLAYAIGLRFTKQYNFYNGPLKAKCYLIDIDAANQLKSHTEIRLNPRMQALHNRLTKNKKHLSKWLKRTQHSAYRLYDADLPDYAVAIDVYADWAHVQEYAPPKEIPEAKAKKRIIELMQLLPGVLGIPKNHIVLKLRKRQKGKAQYQALAKQNKSLTLQEGSALLKVNLHDYLDTGLFLDHRLLRLQFAASLRAKRFLNCFCYTATVSVHAALSGATTCNVDLSNTYLEWAKENFSLNNINIAKHRFIQTDCLQWLKNCSEKFDVIFLDPPSFSNSKRMQATLDIQRDQAMLVDLTMQCLAPNGVLYFSNNLAKFKLTAHIADNYQTQDITQQTLDEDFKRAKKSHHCYRISHNV